MKILITGGFGYIGGRLSQFLKIQKHDLTILANKGKKNIPVWAKGINIFYGDITDKNSLKNCFNGIDVIIHLASVNEIVCEKDPSKAYIVNCIGTQNVLEEAKNSGCKKFIYLSTFHVYGKNEGVISETLCPDPKSVYGITRLTGEQLCKKYSDENFKTIIIRLSNGIGAPADLLVDRWSLIMNELCKSAVTSQKIELKSPGYQYRDFIAIWDICLFIGILINKKLADKTEIYNLGSGKAVMIKDVAQMINQVYIKTYNKNLKIIIPKDDGKRYNKLIFSIAKAKKIGFKPKTNLKNEIKNTLLACEWFL